MKRNRPLFYTSISRAGDKKSNERNGFSFPYQCSRSLRVLRCRGGCVIVSDLSAKRKVMKSRSTASRVPSSLSIVVAGPSSPLQLLSASYALSRWAVCIEARPKQSTVSSRSRRPLLLPPSPLQLLSASRTLDVV